MCTRSIIYLEIEIRLDQMASTHKRRKVMKKLVYVYENGTEVTHTKYISGKSIKRESGDSKKVEIYECNELDLEKRLDGFSAGKYITTIAIQ